MATTTAPHIVRTIQAYGPTLYAVWIGDLLLAAHTSQAKAERHIAALAAR